MERTGVSTKKENHFKVVGPLSPAGAKTREQVDITVVCFPSVIAALVVEYTLDNRRFIDEKEGALCYMDDGELVVSHKWAYASHNFMAVMASRARVGNTLYYKMGIGCLILSLDDKSGTSSVADLSRIRPAPTDLLGLKTICAGIRCDSDNTNPSVSLAGEAAISDNESAASESGSAELWTITRCDHFICRPESRALSSAHPCKMEFVGSLPLRTHPHLSVKNGILFLSNEPHALASKPCTTLVYPMYRYTTPQTEMIPPQFEIESSEYLTTYTAVAEDRSLVVFVFVPPIVAATLDGTTLLKHKKPKNRRAEQRLPCRYAEVCFCEFDANGEPKEGGVPDCTTRIPRTFTPISFSLSRDKRTLVAHTTDGEWACSLADLYKLADRERICEENDEPYEPDSTLLFRQLNNVKSSPHLIEM